VSVDNEQRYKNGNLNNKHAP